MKAFTKQGNLLGNIRAELGSYLIWVLDIPLRFVANFRSFHVNQLFNMYLRRDDSNMDMTAMAKIYNFFSFMNFDK